MTGEFNLLLWAAGVACFVSYGMLPQADNLYLGVVLFCVVTVTGVFSYLQNAKSDNMVSDSASNAHQFLNLKFASTASSRCRTASTPSMRHLSVHASREGSFATASVPHR